jgi:hypothetical protein
MSPMVSTLSWCLRGCVVLTAAALLAGCSRVTVGTIRPARDGGESPPVPVAELLIEPDRFPPQYPAEVLEDAAVNRVLQDIDGVPAGAVVTPHDCGPAEPGQVDTAAVEGIDSATASSLIVVVTRPAPPLSEKLDKLRACPSFEVGRGDETSTVSATLLPAPPVDADDAYAVEQTVTTPDAERRSLTFAAQIGDARVSATWLQDPAVDDADTSSLDTLFRGAVVKLRRDG